jgi:hypothetical protein
MPIKSFTTHLSEAFTRQHYVTIADAIKKVRHQHAGHPRADQLDTVLDSLIDELGVAFKRDNPNFNQTAFRNATK